MPVDPTQSTWPDDPQPPAPPGEATVSLPPTGDSTEPPTEVAPPFRPVLPLEQHRWAGLPGLGQRIGDFELIRVLGQGSFGIVFLARQISLDRRVVVKVTANAGHEAQTLASLEHDHISASIPRRCCRSTTCG
jgi:serine/threonine protein kinase